MNLLPPIQVGEKRDLPVEPNPTANQSVNVPQVAGGAVFNMSISAPEDFLISDGFNNISWIHPT